MRTILLASAMLVTGIAPAHAENNYCAVAGHYEGTYDGQYDRGTVSADVNQTTGVVAGLARSALKSGRTVAVGGLVDSSGALTTDGRVSSGAVFVGHFSPEGAATGQWAQSISISGGNAQIGGTWTLSRTDSAQGCE